MLSLRGTDRGREAKAALEAELKVHAGKPVGVIIRTAPEMAKVAADNPFSDRAANYTAAIFLDRAPAHEVLKDAKGQANEEMRLGAREIYVHYPDGMGRSKLRIPAAPRGNCTQHEHRRQACFDGGRISRIGLSSLPCIVRFIHLKKQQI